MFLSIILLGPLALAALPALGSLAAGGISYLTGRSMNKRNIEYQREQNQADTQLTWDMYNRQRRDALSDFDMQNAYNSPVQQMQRLREAGLNPHMALGGGAQNTGSMVRTSNAAAHSQPPPRANEEILPRVINDIFQNVNAIYQARNTQATTDNLQRQNDVLIQEILLKMRQGDKTAAETDNLRQEGRQRGRMNDLDYQLRLQDIALRDWDLKGRPIANEQLKATLDKTYQEIARIIAETHNTEQATKKLEAETQLTLTHDEIAQLMKSPNFNAAVLENMLRGSKNIHLNQEIQLAMEKLTGEQLDNMMKEIELKMLQDGVNKGDPFYYRLLYQLIVKTLRGISLID